MQTLKIGTRDSELALWQAKHVQASLAALGQASELVLIKSEGEMNLTQPLYELGVQGIFTKTLDIALLNGKIDIAVHSLKDVPTQVPTGITHAATPTRGAHLDLLVTRDNQPLPFEETLTIASSSLRRQAQWLNRYPHHRMEPIRGNINSRLNKLMQSPHWDGTLLAEAGVQRIGLKVPHAQVLDWMLPAPSQGALGIYCRTEDKYVRKVCYALNHEATFLCTYAERMFLRTLMGGCTMPIAAHAEIINNTMHFEGNVLSIDGKDKAEIKLSLPTTASLEMGERAAEALLEAGGKAILETLKKNFSNSAQA